MQIIDLVEQALHLNTGTQARKSALAGPDEPMILAP
jgi:hypothetical protein